MKRAKRYAIARDSGELLVYWTGLKRMPWATTKCLAKTWRYDSIAAAWLPRVPVTPSMENLRVVEV